MSRMPVVFIKPERAIFLGRRLRVLAYSFEKNFPKLKQSLAEGAFDVDPLDYIGAGIVDSLLMGLIFGGLALFVLALAIIKGTITNDLIVLMLFSAVVMPVVFMLYFINYPALVAQRRKRDIDINVIFAVRELIIKLSSGVPIFNAMLDVSNSDYGIVSEEFRGTVEEIEAGISQEAAIRNLSKRTPSQALRRALEILLSSLKAGSDLSKPLGLVNDMLVKKQQADMAKYAAELTPLSMAYMLVSVVLPSLGMSVFLILGSLARVNAMDIIILIPLFLFVFQVFFMGFVNSRRPAVGA